MKKRISAILLACGLSVSMLCTTAFAADSQTEAAAIEEAATEAQAMESELAEDTGSAAQTEAQLVQPRNVEGNKKYEQLYPTIQESITETLSQLSMLSDEQITSALEQPDSASTRLIAAWDQARGGCGEFDGIEYYDVEEEGSTITFTEGAKYKKAEEENSKVTVSVVFDMKNQTSTYNWNVKETTGKAMAAAAENTVVGLVNVFLVLFILTFVISLFRFIPNGSRKKKELEAAEAAAPAAAPEAEPEAEPESAEVSDEDEIAAVIAAAVAACESENGPVRTDGFVVRSIRRRGRRSNWQNA